MQPSIFTTLCDLCDELDAYTRDLEPGPVRDQLEGLVQRFDSVIDRTIGLEQASVSPED
jgi:hypothetical protein